MTDTPRHLIFGAYGGIGTAVSRRLREAGAALTLAGRDAEKLSALGSELDVPTITVDPTDFAAVEKAFDTALETHGGLDGVVNAVGSVLLKPAHLTTDDDYASVIDTNLKSAFALTRAVGKKLREPSSTVFFSSAAARLGLSNHEAIAAAKGAVTALARSAAATYSTKKHRFNVIAPGLVETPMTEKIVGNEKALEASLALHPLGRVGQPEEIASLVEWLVGPDATWVTGQEIGMDGGLGSLKTRAR